MVLVKTFRGTRHPVVLANLSGQFLEADDAVPPPQ